jgi:hypothetical protein
LSSRGFHSYFDGNTGCQNIIGADKPLPRPTSPCILFDGENISFDASLVIYIYIYIYIYSTTIPPIMVINKIYENKNLLSLQFVSFLVGLRTYQHPVYERTVSLLVAGLEVRTFARLSMNCEFEWFCLYFQFVG